MNHQTITAILIALFTFFVLLGGHFFRWNVIESLIDEHGNLKSVARYIYGVGWIGLGFSAWVLINADRVTPIEAVIIFWIMSAAAGLGTLAGYGVDAIIERRIRGKGNGQNHQSG